MAVTIQFPALLLLFLFTSYFIPQSSCQFTPQNIQVFYPFPLPPPPPPLPPLPPPPPPSIDTATPTLTHTPIITNHQSNSSNKTVAKAVAATAASTLVLSGLLFLLLVKYRRYRREKDKEKPELHGGDDNRNTIDPVMMTNNQFTRFEGVKGVIVDEEGLDVLYWKNLDDDNVDNGNKNAVFKKELPRINDNEEEKRMTRVDLGGRKSKKFDVQIQEVPLLRGKSSGSHVWPSGEETKSQYDLPLVVNLEIKSQMSSRSPPPTPPSPPPPPPAPVVVAMKSHVPQPLLLPKTGSLTSSSKPPPPPPQVKLKPLHWDKVNANVGHPTAWDQLDKGSFR